MALGQLRVLTPTRNKRAHYHVAFSDANGCLDYADPIPGSTTYATPRFAKRIEAETFTVQQLRRDLSRWIAPETYCDEGAEKSTIDAAHVLACNRDCER